MRICYIIREPRGHSAGPSPALVRAPPPLGADQRVHDLEVVDRPALVAGATSRAQAVNFMAGVDGCILLGVPVQHRCSGAAHRTIAPEPSEFEAAELVQAGCVMCYDSRTP